MPHYMLFRTPVALSTRTSGFPRLGPGFFAGSTPVALLLPCRTRGRLLFENLIEEAGGTRDPIRRRQGFRGPPRGAAIRAWNRQRGCAFLGAFKRRIGADFGRQHA